MITHNVAFRLTETDPGIRAEQAAEFGRRLRALEGKISGLRSISVGIDLRRLDGNYDLVLISTHDSYEELEAYQANPVHREVIEYGRTIVAERASVDYETSDEV